MRYYYITYGFALISLIITLAARAYINLMYKKYSRIDCTKKMSGAEVARLILKKNNLDNIYVVETSGTLTDHYDPTRKVIRLSHNIYNDESISSVSVAAHECGHAIQDKVGYTLMRIRSTIIPFVNFSTYIGYVVLFIGLIASSTNLIWGGIFLEMGILLFQLVTLPVEIDASKRAIAELETLQILVPDEVNGAKKVLTAAALTYVAALASAVLEILRLIILYGNRRD